VTIDDRWLSLVALLGWLIVALSGYASYRLNWKKSVTMALAWAAIFVGVAVLAAFFGGQAG
jgi:hypothetical protein